MGVLSVKMVAGAPLVDIILSGSGTHLQGLSDARKTLPPLQYTRGLVDTGASATCVDRTVLEALSLNPTGSRRVYTPSTGTQPVELDTYTVGLIVSYGVEERLVFVDIRVYAADFSAQNYKVLLGRDVLARCLLIYDGKHQSMTLAY